MSDTIVYQQGFPDALRTQAAALYDSAFGQKLRLAMPDRIRRQRLLAASFNPRFSLVALRNGTMVGIAGFKTTHGALTGGINARTLLGSLGLLGMLRAAPVLSLYDRPSKAGQLLMDGIAVSPDARGNGIGSQLLDKLQRLAKADGFRTIRLDVIDTNPQARKLYERLGFAAVSETDLSALRWLLGFGGATTMEMVVVR